jgi:hypothetical protein
MVPVGREGDGGATGAAMREFGAGPKLDAFGGLGAWADAQREAP